MLWSSPLVAKTAIWVTEHEAETHELFNNEAAQAYIGQERRLMDVRRAAGKPPPAASSILS